MSEGPAPVPVVAASRSDRSAFFGLATVSLIVAILARAQDVLVPMALAVVLSFALGPAVKHLERKLGRAVAVVVVVVVALGAVTAFGYMLERQLVDLSTQMTKYSDSIGRKVRALRGNEDAGLSGLSKSVDKVVREMDQQVAVNEGARSVRVIPADASAMDRIESALAPVVEPLTRSVVVFVLVIFLLIKREDIRDRFIRLIGSGHVTLTTRTLDEAGERISRFLTHQSAINAGFGVVVTGGLLLIGIPYAPLWGFVVAMLRFIPFVGTLLAMVFPAALAFAQFKGWWQLGATVGLFLGLDALAAYVVEPIVIGAKTGVSSMAILASAIFWSWLWGPVGLVLSTPMTVCLAVLGKHVPRLSYLAVLLGDEPALEDDMVVYHRLLSGDEEEAQEIIETRLAESTRARVFDEVIIPALLRASRDRTRNEITEADHQQVVATIRALVDVVKAPGAAVAPRLVLGVSARAGTDEAIWDMLAQLFDPEKVRVESVGSAYLSSDLTTTVVEQQPDLVCVLSIPPGGLAQARYLCRRLRAKHPTTPILVIRPGVQANGKESALRLTEDGATQVCFTLEDAHTGAEQQLITGQRSLAPVARVSAATATL
jgi:predicted PurR-regulated permease PerM